MKRFRRVILNALTVLSAVLFVCIVVLWVRSHYVFDQFGRAECVHQGDRAVESFHGIFLGRGRISIGHGEYDYVRQYRYALIGAPTAAEGNCYGWFHNQDWVPCQPDEDVSFGFALSWDHIHHWTNAWTNPGISPPSVDVSHCSFVSIRRSMSRVQKTGCKHKSANVNRP